jgi:hypothetical protein
MADIRHAIALAAACIVGGCAAVPNTPQADGILVENIVDEIQCELSTVYAVQNEDAARNWAAGITLNLKVINDAATSPTATLTPVISAGTLTVPIGPDLHDQTTRNVELTYNVHLRDLDPRKRAGGKFESCPTYSGLPQASEGMGLDQWLATAASAMGRNKLLTFSGTTYDLEFVVTRGAHGGVTFQNAQVNVQAGASSISKTNDNHLTVAFTYDPLPSKVAGKTLVSFAAQDRLFSQSQRFLPQRVILQTGNGLTIVP